MKMFKRLCDIFHNWESFKKHGIKQLSTWAGILIFMCLFYDDLLVMIHNALRSEDASQKLLSAIAGGVLILFKRIKKKDE